MNIAKLVVSVLSSLKLWNMELITLFLVTKNIQYLDYLGYRKTSTTFEEELLTLGKQRSKNITPPRSNSNITEIQVSVVSMFQLAIHCSYEKLSTPLCILVDIHELNIVWVTCKQLHIICFICIFYSDNHREEIIICGRQFHGLKNQYCPSCAVLTNQFNIRHFPIVKTKAITQACEA